MKGPANSCLQAQVAASAEMGGGGGGVCGAVGGQKPGCTCGTAALSCLASSITPIVIFPMASSSGIPKLIGFVPMSQTQTCTWRGGSRAHCARRARRALVERGGQEADGADRPARGAG